MRLSLRSRSTLQGFTLIELLVVITIIALLISLLLPALQKAQKMAKTAVCLSNGRSMALAMQAYLTDNSDFYPGGTYNGVVVQWYTIAGQKGTVGSAPYNADSDQRVLQQYLASPEVAQCPLDMGDATSFGQKRWEYTGSSYILPDRGTNAIRAGMIYVQYGVWHIEGHRATEVPKTSNKAIILEVLYRLERPASDPRHHWHNDADPLLSMMNFADGHAEMVPRFTEFSTPLEEAWPYGPAVEISRADLLKMSGKRYY